MPNPVWHPSLPQSQFLGTALGYPNDTVLRFAVDAGPAKTRTHYTSAPRAMSIPIVLTHAQKQVWKTFYETTLKYGALEFDWVDPVTDTVATMRFLAGPRFIMRGSSISGRRWEATLELEVLP